MPEFLKHLSSILQNLFRVLFYLADHRVCLGELGVIGKQNAIDNYPRSMKFYLLQNVFGFVHNLISIGVEILKTKNGEDG